MVKTPQVGALGHKAKGPMLVMHVQNQSIKVKNLMTGRVGWEHRSNCTGLRTVMEET